MKPAPTVCGEVGCDAAISQPTPGGEVGTRNTTPPVNQRRAGAEVVWRVEPVALVIRRRRTGDGAPYGASRSVQQQIHAVRHPEEGGVGDAAPYGGCEMWVSAEP